MNIVLTGFMGTGKTATSRELLKLLNKNSDGKIFKLIDTDKRIEYSEGRKINDIFKEEGEIFFRNLEHDLAKDLAKDVEYGAIISTGGGFVLNKSNINLLKPNSIIFCLKASKEVIYDRIKNNKDRPLLKDPNPLEKIEKLLKDREKFYKNCDFAIDTDNKTILEVAESIKKIFENIYQVDCNRDLKYPEYYRVYINDYLKNKAKLFDKTLLLRKIVSQKTNKILVITDSNVSKYHLTNFLSELKLDLKETEIFFHIVPSGENNKTLSEINKIWEVCSKNYLDRNSLIISLGGGMVSDMAGFVASTYMRGIKCIHFPTTLLAMVDASIGGKTGFDLSFGKNLVGTFYQPEFVFIEPEFLNSLDERNFISGMAEVIKYSVIYDFRIDNLKMYDFIEKNISNLKNSIVLNELIRASIKIKSDIVSRDLHEGNLRKILNFGHTLGHSMETFFDYKYLHGEMVAFGMLFSLYLSSIYEKSLDFIEEKIFKILTFLYPKELFINSFNHLKDPESLEKIVNVMKDDKKGIGNGISFVLLQISEKKIITAFKVLDIEFIREKLNTFTLKYINKF